MGTWIKTLAVLMITCSSSSIASIPSFDRLDLDTRQMYPFNTFPYREYFVCIRNSDASQLAYHLEQDPLIRDSWRKVVGETAARFYRYLNNMPQKHLMADTPIANSNGRYPKEPQPYTFDRQYFYAHQDLNRRKFDYHYDLDTRRMFQTWRGERSQKYWIEVIHRFYQRESDYKLAPLDQLGSLFVLLSIDMDAVRAAKSEQEAYHLGSRNSKAYFFRANPEHCK